LLWYESDPLGFKKTPRVREQQIGPDGRYRICGLPETMNGKLQVFRGGVQTGEVPVELGGTSGTNLLAMRSMSISSTSQVVASASTDTGAKTTIVRGRSRVTGKILNKYGQPIVGARVELQNTGAATKTRANGDFTLDSLPSGTQTLEIRQRDARHREPGARAQRRRVRRSEEERHGLLSRRRSIEDAADRAIQ